MSLLFISNPRAFARRTAIFLINLMLLGISITASFASTQIKTFIELFFKSQNVGQSSSGHTTLQYCLVVMNALIVELLNILYDQIYIKMTDYENYSDLQEYETSLILKRFTFKLINMFNSMVIIALFKSAFPLIFGVCTDFGLSAKGSTYCFIELRVQGWVFADCFFGKWGLVIFKVSMWWGEVLEDMKRVCEGLTNIYKAYTFGYAFS